MIPDLSQLADYGGTVIIAVVAFWSLVQILKNKKNSGWDKKSYGELQQISNNHLNHIEDTIRQGNERIVKAINEGNQKMIELLGEIKGRLSK